MPVSNIESGQCLKTLIQIKSRSFLSSLVKIEEKDIQNKTEEHESTQLRKKWKHTELLISLISGSTQNYES